MNDEDQQEEVDLPAPAVPEPAHPATGTLSPERVAAKALETRLLGGERKLRRREV
ncbi:MAG TPA: adenylate/guanylate cyclase domain-containing protein, partial [Arthrobacter bacterium]|nr:adenylate/guanylate cyclase domain-containing protein [Arthrobacter sp.]